MKKIAFLVFTFGVFISNNLKAETVFYCQEELSSGVINEKGSWKVTSFKEERYTIKFKNDYSILEGLEPDIPFSCDMAFHGAVPNTYICVSGYNSGASFLIDTNTGRFVYSHPSSVGGYIKNRNDTDNLSVGTCEKF